MKKFSFNNKMQFSLTMQFLLHSVNSYERKEKPMKNEITEALYTQERMMATVRSIETKNTHRKTTCIGDLVSVGGKKK